MISDGSQLPYNSRILVRRPHDPARFNGTVYYEVLNATAGWDGDPIWQSNYEYITREGAIWVGMSTKPVTVNFLRDGWAAWPGVERNAERYADLAMPAFGQVWDMLAQTALLMKTPDEANNPLAGFAVERIIMVGYSQSAAYQVTFVNSFHADATMPDGNPTIDGYFISAGGDNAKHATGPSATTPESLPAGDARNFLLTEVPTLRFQTQTEVVNFPSWPVRQSEEDSPWLRFYEMAGGSHVDAQINEVGGQALVRDLGLPPGFCFLFGAFIPFTEEELSARYRNHGSYVSRFMRAVKESEKEGFLLREEARELRRSAATGSVGKPAGGRGN